MHPAIAHAIQTLLDEDKTPSVALIKSKLPSPLPIPEIIAAMSAYKQYPDSIKSLSQPIAERQAESSSQLDRIEAKLDKLLALLERK
ncbi:hypothetical protein ACSLBF_12135 [Pseudoalteromonas sp. T1lg65]|uniref:hypothetical protein n=1 Tax=Pseudoalteromonas sp. T1lg65 TaxID=2077101 RepID=UPI003F7973CB